MSARPPGDSTRAVRAGVPDARQGEPLLPGPVLASAYHLAGDDVHGVPGYLRHGNPTWEAYEDALGELEGGEVVLFASGMAAVSAILLSLGPGDVLAAPHDGYPGVADIARDPPRPARGRGAARGHRAGGPGGGGARRDARVGRDAVEPGPRRGRRPGRGGRRRRRPGRRRHDAGRPLRLAPLALGAACTMCSASKALTGHSDLLLGYVATADPERARTLREWRSRTGGIPGPFEAWLAHRSLATYALRLERMEANAAALADLLRNRVDVRDVRWPGVGSVVGFELPDAEAARAFLAACSLVTEATSFGGVHSSAERRARWGYDDAPPGWIRFSAGVEDAEDLLADVARALDAA